MRVIGQIPDIILSNVNHVINHFHPWHIVESLRHPYHLLDSITMRHHRSLDYFVVRLTHNSYIFPYGFFSDGWGDVSVPSKFYKALAASDLLNSRIHSDRMHFTKRVPHGSYAYVQEGFCPSPLKNKETLLPLESQMCHFQLVTPKQWSTISTTTSTPPYGTPNYRPLVVLLPGTGEQGYLRRRISMALPLAKRGIASLILEGPFYGKRRPKNQKGTKLRRVSDLPVLGRCTIEETCSLLYWFHDNLGYQTLAVAGGSMGGLHAAMTGSLMSFPVGIISWLGPPSAVSAFTKGLFSLSCDWNFLSNDAKEKQLDILLSSLTSRSYAETHTLDEVHRQMSEFLSITDITLFPSPIRADAAIFAIATEDAYIGENSAHWKLLQDKWRGVDIRHIRAGHVSGILFQRDAFQTAIEDSLCRIRTHME